MMQQVRKRVNLSCLIANLDDELQSTKHCFDVFPLLIVLWKIPIAVLNQLPMPDRQESERGER